MVTNNAMKLRMLGESFMAADPAERPAIQKEIEAIRNESRARNLAWRRAYPHTHYELRDPRLRLILEG